MFENSIENLNHNRYLGSARVVDGLIRDFVASVMSAGSEDEVIAVSNKYGDIFSGVDASYIQVDGWANRSKLGRELEQRVGVDPDQSFVDMVRTAFVVWASELMDTVVSTAGDVEAAKPKVDAIIQDVVAVLMGTASMQLGGSVDAA